MSTESTSKVMVIDDDERVLVSVKRMLERQGYCVVVHDGGPGCFKEVANFKPNLVLIDVNMPFLSGDAFVALFGQCSAITDSKIVLFSAIDELTLEQKVRDCGAQGYICKTDSGLEFGRKVAGFLRQEPAAI